jgi:hypothetical protein
MNHRVTAMRVALAARCHARLAADAAVRIDEELQVHGRPPMGLNQKSETRNQKEAANRPVDFMSRRPLLVSGFWFLV